MFKIKALPHELFDPLNAPMLTGILRGAEREALRVDPAGGLALTPHPKKLGSALTHPRITTDFSESLMEFITPPSHRVCELFKQLEELQSFTAKHLDSEILWSSSMPCALVSDDQIPVALYGDSNNGRMKTAYRVGLGHRYGRTMQTVSGLHYNFSLPNAFWAFLSSHENSSLDLQEFKNQKYFALIRNFRRHYWLLIYLFGASPAICRSFAKDKDHNLEPLGEDDHTLHLPYATSLRMGDLGYQSSAQESLYVCYNEQHSYINSLCRAITTQHPEYEAIGTTDEQGERKQLNTSLLQIENEFYSSVRPKRTAKHGETALSALSNRGVEYVEVRCLDINPFTPLGLTKEQVYFLDTFLVYCALEDSPNTDRAEGDMILRNQKKVVTQGRSDDLKLEHHEYGELSRLDWSTNLLSAMQPIAELLDTANNVKHHSKSLKSQLDKVNNPGKTPSAMFLNDLLSKQRTFAQHTLTLSKENHQKMAQNPLNTETEQRLREMAEKSLEDQGTLEEASKEEFETFLKRYYSQYTCCGS